jgi:hypothetical protein
VTRDIDRRLRLERGGGYITIYKSRLDKGGQALKKFRLRSPLHV